ncbi:MAG: SDR family NAD(P)-dependent oxidoreductase [Spirochaetales bacterium]|nr:SDR family NAD(P)-dependent oxidoreductase [Spirochaetales bacterium]
MNVTHERHKILQRVMKGEITPGKAAGLIKSLLLNQNTDFIPDKPGPVNKSKGTAALVNIPDDNDKSGNPSDVSKGEIAIIGMSGLFPGAKNINEFWDNLVAGKNSIKDIPKERWRWDSFLKANPQFTNTKPTSHWGGFLSNIDEFDPFFFGLSIKEAEMMDPRQRLFLQEAWKALEDAGYSDVELNGKECGVFVGCQEGDYMKNYPGEINPYVPTGSSNSILASRLAYILNLKGPAVAIDTACSSALVAVSLACQSLRQKNSEIAIAGGVLVMSTPLMFLSLDKLNMFSPKGRCMVFDNDADGTVIGEAVGVVVLKSYEASLKDGNHIYGIIKGIEINQDGKSSGITAPSASSQTALENKLYKHLNINPETISYIEAHGTGTKLGDPIEIHALTDSFKQFTNKKQFCAIGSVKTNIGHSMPAAGIASLIKVLCCLKHKMLVPSLNYKQQNAHINFDSTPFYVNTGVKNWNTEKGIPRRAAISSFGFSGTNCHLIVEEPPGIANPEELESSPYHLVLLSAGTKAALETKISDLIPWLEHNGKEYPMKNICYTLNCGRSHMKYRIACIVKDYEDLAKELDSVMNHKPAKNVLSSTDTDKAHPSPGLKAEIVKLVNELDSTTNDATDYYNRLNKIAELYVKKYNADWRLLYNGISCKKISMPVYPFARDKYWFEVKEETPVPITVPLPVSREQSPYLHPLVHKNTSTIEREKFSTDIKGNEFYLTDHIINGLKVMPGAVHMEMARAAGFFGSTRHIRRISNVVWTKPVMATHGITIHISIFPADEYLDYTVFSQDSGEEEIIHSQGRLYYENFMPAPLKGIDIEALKKRKVSYLDGDECYDYFKKSGFAYGESFRPIKELYIYEKEALSRIELPGTTDIAARDFVLHPSLLDGAFQTVMGVMMSKKSESEGPRLPFLLGSLEMYKPLQNTCYVYLKVSGDQKEKEPQIKKYDITITDDKGSVLIAIKDFCLKELKNGDKAIEGPGIRTLHQNASCQLVYSGVEWVKQPLADQPAISGENIIVFENNNYVKDALESDDTFLKCRIIQVKPGNSFTCSHHDDYKIRPFEPDDYKELFQRIIKNGMKPSIIIHSWCRDVFDLSEEQIEKQVKTSLYSLTFLTRELINKKNKIPIKVIFIHPLSGSTGNPVYASISGFAACLYHENKKISFKSIAVDDNVKTSLTYLKNELDSGNNSEIKYQNGERFVKNLKEIKFNSSDKPRIILKQRGTYLITGGMGGLGNIISRYLAEHYHSRLLLVGRSPVNDRIMTQLKKLRESGGEAEYMDINIATKDGAKKIISGIKKTYGSIDGVFHCAGINRDSYIQNKTAEEIDAVLAPKVYGTVFLYEALKNETLDFIMYFSSTAALLGNAGQSDYAYANSFLNNFTEWLIAARDVKTALIAVNWPLWRDGGMRVNEEYQKLTEKLSGMLPLPGEAGIEALNNALCYGKGTLAVLYGNPQKINQVLGFSRGLDMKNDRVENNGVNDNNFNKTGVNVNTILNDLIQLALKLAHINSDTIGADDDIQEFGFDSVAITAYTNEINYKYNLELTPAVFFELDAPTIRALATYLINEYKQEFNLYYEKTVKSGTPFEQPVTVTTGKIKNRFNPAGPGQADQIQKPDITEKESIAIIGLHAIMPQSEDAGEFWKNIEEEKDLVTGIPGSRAKWLAGIKQARYGGFMKEIDKFDPDFFHISPREAKIMDPQQRILLESVWKVIEDAGYNPRELAGKNVGMFIGVSSSDYYDLLLKNSITIDATGSLGISNSIRANRLSFQYDFHGPSEPIDTACSSSLVAIHRGIEAIRSGTCEIAIAGGVNVITSPTLFNTFYAAGMLSDDGKCKTFDSHADGYVRGEGAGLVVLKSLGKAEQDGDDIYACITSTMVNHGGRAKSLTSPNANAQARLLVEVYRRAGIEPDTVTYIEAHGTGTTLGDPVEINGLKKAFKELFLQSGKPEPAKPFCGLGSVKTNIGHLEAAAGIAGVVKVIMAMKNKKIPASINYNTLNPYIDLKGSPFYIVHRTKEWEHIVDKTGKPVPRRAGISSFGYGGSNAHIVLEEYQGNTFKPADRDAPRLIVLSARNKDRLREYAQKFLNFLSPGPDNQSDTRIDISIEDIKKCLINNVCRIIGINSDEVDPELEYTEYGFDMITLSSLAWLVNSELNVSITTALLHQYPTINLLAAYLSQGNLDYKNQYSAGTISLANMAYTLQTGREHMEERLAMVVKDIDDLCKKIRLFLAGKQGNDIYTGSVILHKSSGQHERKDTETLLPAHNLHEYARHYVTGSIIDWNIIHSHNNVHRVHLPTYPFERQVYWFDENIQTGEAPLEKDHPDNKDNLSGFPKKLTLKNVHLNDSHVTKTVTKPSESSSRFDETEIIVNLKRMLGAVLYKEPSGIDENKAFMELGLDSILGVEFVKKIKDEMKISIKATVLYDYSTLTKLAKLLISKSKESQEPVKINLPSDPIKLEKPSSIAVMNTPVVTENNTANKNDVCGWKDIAVIGMALRYPGANNSMEFWVNLKNGINSVTEVPVERWDITKYYDPDRNAPDKIYCKWGGFVEDVDKFDPLFFNISPAEAEILDPQQRLFLQEVWRALEDAGYTLEKLDNTRCGIFAGVMTSNEYPPHLFNAHSILAARGAYFLNLKASALSVDTACSSSLVATHLACRSLINGESDMMIAGGVTLYLTANPYLSMCRSGMLSPSGKCSTFDDSADGFVPGEGVGVIVLKLLDKAIEDGDTIYGVIKGSGTNQDGKTNGITAPSTQSQLELELDLYENSNINPETIDYVECHGTGTKLGDPIEMDALIQAFKKYTQKKHYCRVGSVKSNIGHTSAASGVVGLIKVLLSLKNGMIPPTINFNKANMHINFEESPFIVNTTLHPWERKAGLPRRAAISSFGFSGTNVHMIIEEPPPAKKTMTTCHLPYYLILLSAKDAGVLEDKIHDLQTWLDGDGKDKHIGDIACTLSTCRNHFKYRCAIVCAGIQDLKNKLMSIKNGQANDCCFINKNDVPVDHGYGAKETVNYLIDKISRKQYTETESGEMLMALGDFYSKGVEINWDLFYTNSGYTKISMPAYPFKKDRYWIVYNPPDLHDNRNLTNIAHQNTKAVSNTNDIAGDNNDLLTGINKSKNGKNVMGVKLTGAEFFLRDNVVYGKKMLPGVVYLEMARMAAEILGNKKVQSIKDLFWINPITVDKQALDIEVELSSDTGDKTFSIHTAGNNKELNATGTLVFLPAEQTENSPDNRLDLKGIKKQCNRQIKGADCYKGYQERLFFIGPGLQAMKVMYYNDTEALAELELPAGYPDLDKFVLHPSLMDAALQTVTGLLINTTNDPPGRPYLSFSLKEAVLVSPLTRKCVVYATFSKKTKTDASFRLFNILVADSTGNIQVRLNNFCIKQPLHGMDEKNKTVPIKDDKEKQETNNMSVIPVLCNHIATVICTLLKLKKSELDYSGALIDYGFTSITMIEFIKQINDTYGIDSATEMFFEDEKITVTSLAQSLYNNYSNQMGNYFKDKMNQSHNNDEGNKRNDTDTLAPVVADKAIKTKNSIKMEGKSEKDIWLYYKQIEGDILKLAQGKLKIDDNGFDLISVGELIGTINQKYDFQADPEKLMHSSSFGEFIKDLVKKNREKIMSNE